MSLFQDVFQTGSGHELAKTYDCKTPRLLWNEARSKTARHAYCDTCAGSPKAPGVPHPTDSRASAA